MRHRLVVARWDEDVSWCADYSHVIYDKCGTPLEAAGLNVVELHENPGGHETHTYLHHIIANYDQLDDWTTFCQAIPFDHAAAWGHEWEQEPLTGFAWIGSYPLVDGCNGKPHHGPCLLPVGEVFATIFHKEPRDHYLFYAGAQFVASRELIRRRPLKFWQGVQEMGLYPPYEQEYGYTIERLWGYLFSEAFNG